MGIVWEYGDACPWEHAVYVWGKEDTRGVGTYSVGGVSGVCLWGVSLALS